MRFGAVVITAVSGMGGVGKTELATQYARLHEQDYPGGICWLSVRDTDLAASIVQFAQLVMNLQVLQQDFSGKVLSLSEYELHLIQWEEDTSGEYKIRIHTLIREFLKVKLAALEQADDFKRGFGEAMVAIAKTIPDSPTVELINSVKDGIPHLAEVVQNLIDAVELRKRLFIEESPAVAESYNNVGNLYHKQGRYSEAESHLQKALELRKRLLIEESPEVALSYNNLACLYLSQGRYGEAQTLHQTALELRQRLLGEEHPDVAQSYNNLAEVYKKQGRYTEAVPLYQKALEIAELSLGVDHPSTTTIRENLKSLRDTHQ